MAEKNTTQRKLAPLTGISKSRLGVLLHRDPEKRATMTLPEFERILHALGMNLVHAYVCLKAFKDLDTYYRRCYSTAVFMLCDICVGTPQKMIGVLEELGGIDGTEIRLNWSPALQNALIKKVTEEVEAIHERRNRLTNGGDFDL
ncbi:hypothetical protein SxD43FB_17355 [Sphingobium sp. D43FB]|nr:hypothetical protein SxD43FB_17355 [Sphingobium sp. D43FB]